MSSVRSSDWISVSIFYNKDSWTNLLKVIEGYLLDQQHQKYIKNTLLYFSSEQGEHIRLALEVGKADKNILTAELRHLLSNYIDLNPSCPNPREEDYIGRTLFMKFQNNSVHFNLFSLRFEESLLEFKYKLSKSIISYFSTEKVDEHSLLTCIIFYIMCLYHENKQYNTRYIHLLDDIIDNGVGNEKLSDIDFYTEVFNENQETLLQMYLEAESPEDSFVCRWKEVYRNLIKDGQMQYDSATCFLPLDRTIIDHLYIKKDIIAPVYYLIYLCRRNLG